MKKPTVKLLRNRLWVLCRQLTFGKYGNTCYTCGRRNLEGSSLHCGHLWPRATLSNHLKWDIRILRPQCPLCNTFNDGEGAVFYRNMVKEIGQRAMDKLEKEKQILVKADVLWFQKKIEEYQKMI